MLSPLNHLQRGVRPDRARMPVPGDRPSKSDAPENASTISCSPLCFITRGCFWPARIAGMISFPVSDFYSIEPATFDTDTK